ncbi:Autotransporter adhesin [hydrothermal vent metagenome]|uniref:Autotransporter adhesin n=1 Tax=hydrothermal vent metagenome TaxID=652676 RepID=A0A1W1C6H6_9ZZZZ
MKKSIVLSGIAALALFSLVGCGGSDSSDNTQTGTGYYVDSAVAGVDYTCGNRSGVTGSDGKFVFEKGQDCTFKLNNIPLRSVPASDLADGTKIVENNTTVAQLLQSIDTDGNVSNGIQISKEVAQAVEEAIKNLNVTTPKVDEVVKHLDTVVEEVKQKVGEDKFKGRVRTLEEVQEHLKNTEAEVTKEFIAGKTFYVVGNGDDGIWYGKAEFSKDLTNLKWTDFYDPEDSGTASIQLDGNKLIFLGDDDGSYTIIGSLKGDYIEITDYYGDGTVESHTRAYFDKAKADAYVKSLKNSSETSYNGTTEQTKELVAGKVFYIPYYENNQGVIEKITFNDDATSLT